MTAKLCATDKARAALARRVPPAAAKPKPPQPPPQRNGTATRRDAKPEPQQQPLNKFEIAGRARRAAHQARGYRVRTLRAKLVEMFPGCFKPVGGPVLPLKIGIHKDVLAAVPASAATT